MYKKRKLEAVLVVMVILMAVLSLKLISMESKFNVYNNHTVTVTNKVIAKEETNVDKYGYGDILECLRGNSDLQIQCINIIENQKCNVEVRYNGDIKLLYTSLYSLSEYKNFLGVNSISINKSVKIASISIDFKKNK